MFVVTLNKTSLKKVGAGALCCALVIFSAFLGAVHQHPHGGGSGRGEPDRERTGHPDLVHGLRAGCGRHVHHGG